VLPKTKKIKDYSSISFDSRELIENGIFVALKGEKTDGHRFIDEAIAKGASLIVVNEDSEIATEERIKDWTKNKPEIDFKKVPDSREDLAKLSAEFYDYPAKKLSMIGVTGTNGKTTITHLIQSLLSDSLGDCALIGTLGLKKNPEGDYLDFGNTTPASTLIQKTLSDLVKENFQYVTMEVSSHALDQKRVAEIEFKTSVISNLTQDHLDYHITMEEYFKAKSLLIRQTTNSLVLNGDDLYSEAFRKIAEEEALEIFTYGVEKENLDLKASNIRYEASGISFRMELSKRVRENFSLEKDFYDFKLNLYAKFNVYNALVAICVALLESIAIDKIQERLRFRKAINGRFEVIKRDKSPFCVVDYAHSPDGLKNVLEGARSMIASQGLKKLITVFGCGGDRDISKRPLMGEIASQLSDFVYVTSDNPRSEDPDQIIADIMAGISDLERVQVIPDRAEAIREAISRACSEDLVVIAGKGHENYQILKDRTIHFDDREEVLKSI
jgi:UDP-N-acetylmuramoyl-L-alanyl-D-glutamate--2,6-diaminopimelate ligase